MTSHSFTFETFARDLSDAAIETLFVATQHHRVRFVTSPRLCAVAADGGTWSVLPPRRRPLGSLSAFLFELIAFYRERADERTAKRMHKYLRADRRDAILIACETPAADLMSSRLYLRSVDDLLGVQR